MGDSFPRSGSRRWALLLLIAVAACKKDEAGDDDSATQEKGEEERATLVRVQRPTVGSIALSIASSATVDSDRRADVVLETTGTVESILAEEGDAVRAGQVLAELRNPQLRGELDRAIAAFDRAREQVDSLRGLLEQGFLARNDFDEAELALRNATTTRTQAEEAHAARLIVSPIDGTVSRRDLRFGEAVSPGRIAFQVVDLSTLRVDVSLPERDLVRLRTGMPAVVRSELLGGDGVPGQVQRISPVVDAASGTVKVTVALDPNQTLLRPGMFVLVGIEVDRHDGAVLIPKRALVWDEGDAYAFTVESGSARRHKLSLGFEDRDQVEVLEGLTAESDVVIVGQGLLREGVAVRAETGESAAPSPDPAAAPTPAPSSTPPPDPSPSPG